MAVLDDFPGLKVEVLVDGAPLPEYDDEDEDGCATLSVKYIEARSGAEFALRSTFSAPFSTQLGVEVKASVDGSKGRKIAYKPNELYDQRGVIQRGVSFQKDDKWFRRNYCFTALSIVEEVEGATSIADLRKDIEAKGCITLTFRYITNISTRSRPGKGRRCDDLPLLGAIPEKALKGDARSHQATLNPPHAIGPRKLRLKYDVVDKEPFATFHFKYRSLAALKALRVINDEDVGRNILEDQSKDELTPTQLREVVRRMRRREAENGVVKQEDGLKERIKRERDTEQNDDTDDDEVTITKTRTLKRPRLQPEVIVLD